VFISGFHIARNTFRETLREPIYLLLLLSALTLIGLYPMFSFFVFRQQVKLVVDSSMATTMVFGWVTAVLSASHAISREIRTGTALLVLSKPVDRPTFLTAKIAGILAALLVFWFLCTLDVMVAVRIARDQFHLDNRALAAYFGALVIGLGAGAEGYATMCGARPIPKAPCSPCASRFPWHGSRCSCCRTKASRPGTCGR